MLRLFQDFRLEITLSEIKCGMRRKVRSISITISFFTELSPSYPSFIPLPSSLSVGLSPSRLSIPSLLLPSHESFSSYALSLLLSPPTLSLFFLSRHRFYRRLGLCRGLKRDFNTNKIISIINSGVG